MEWKDVGNVIKKYAPLLGTVLGGPAVGGAVGMLCNTFGVDESVVKNDPAQLITKIQMDPEWQFKLAQVEANNIVELRRLALESDRDFLMDRQNARAADIEKTRATGSRDWAMYVLAAIVVTGFFALTALMMFKALPEGSSDAVYLLFGGLNTSFAAVVSYFFGSSKSSSDKTKIIAGSK